MHGQKVAWNKVAPYLNRKHKAQAQFPRDLSKYGKWVVGIRAKVGSESSCATSGKYGICGHRNGM